MSSSPRPFTKIRTSKNSPLNTVVVKRQEMTTVEAPFPGEQHPFYEYIPYTIDYEEVKFTKKLPKSFLCNQKLVVPVLDQAECGSCWAFATCSSLSDRINIGCNRMMLKESLTPTIPLTCNFFLETSQEKIFDINYINTIANLRNIIDNLACHGNSVVLTCFFLHTWGTFRQKCAGYKAENVMNVEYDNTNFGFRSSQVITSNINFSSEANTVTCGAFYGNIGRSVNTSNCFGRVVSDNKVYMTPAQSFRCLLYYSIENAVNKNENIMRDIFEWGPVCTSFQVHSDFYDFNPEKDGVYISNEDPTTLVGGHAVCISGWGVYTDKKTGKDIPFWWIKNSWGQDFGENGYFRMLRGSNHCRIEENIIGMIPNYFPNDINELNHVMKKLETKWKIKKTIHANYIQLYKTVLKEYALLSDDFKNVMFREDNLMKYPIIDYFFFHMPYRALFQIVPTTGYTRFNMFELPGLDYSPPFRYKDCQNI